MSHTKIWYFIYFWSKKSASFKSKECQLDNVPVFVHEKCQQISSSKISSTLKGLEVEIFTFILVSQPDALDLLSQRRQNARELIKFLIFLIILKNISKSSLYYNIQHSKQHRIVSSSFDFQPPEFSKRERFLLKFSDFTVIKEQQKHQQ